VAAYRDAVPRQHLRELVAEVVAVVEQQAVGLGREALPQVIQQLGSQLRWDLRAPVRSSGRGS
jgi:hypothetical protein